MDHKLIAILEDIAVLSELAGENPFKARAYANAARILDAEKIDIAEAVRLNRLSAIPGIGSGLRETLREYVETGAIAEYEKLKAEVPPGLLDMTRLRGLGAKKVRSIFLQLGIQTVGELEYACRENRLRDLKGFGEKSQDSILKAIEFWNTRRGRYHQHKALFDAEQILAVLCNSAHILRSAYSGELRRRAETVTGLHFIVHTNDEKALAEYLKEQVSAELREGLYSFSSQHGLPVGIELVANENFGWRKFRTTGSEEFVGECDALLKKKKFTVAEDSVKKDGKTVDLSDEQKLFDLMGLPFIEPELREDTVFIPNAQKNALPKLIENDDLRGMLHIHTTWSDGRDSVKAMASAAKELGFSYIAVCDHSRTAVYAGGLSIERVHDQHKEIDALNKKGNLGIRILKGIESDILPDGSLDYPDEVLAAFDIVVASVHSSFTMPAEAMTARIIKALKNPHTTILGHPTGRLLLARNGYDLDLHAIIDTAAKHGKIIEINANPYRLDLSWEFARYAREKGVLLAINPDAHSADALEQVYFGVGVARKAGLEAKQVVNTFSEEEFLSRFVKAR